jgi:group I intron endonuclease
MPAMNIYSIYKTLNKINGKIYIGFDSNWPRRKLEHKSHSKDNCETQILHKAIKKYGWDNFEWEVIYQSKDYEHCLNVMENYFIKEYKSFGDGYNMTKGGEGSLGNKNWLDKKHSNETKLKMSQSHKGKVKTKEHIQKIALANTGKKRPKSEEHIQKISKALRGKPKGPMSQTEKNKRSETMKKRTFSPEHRQNTIQNLPRGGNHPMAKPITINGIWYSCKKEAMAKLNLSLRQVNAIATHYLPQIGR